MQHYDILYCRVSKNPVSRLLPENVTTTLGFQGATVPNTTVVNQNEIFCLEFHDGLWSGEEITGTLLFDTNAFHVIFSTAYNLIGRNFEFISLSYPLPIMQHLMVILPLTNYDFTNDVLFGSFSIDDFRINKYLRTGFQAGVVASHESGTVSFDYLNANMSLLLYPFGNKGKRSLAVTWDSGTSLKNDTTSDDFYLGYYNKITISNLFAFSLSVANSVNYASNRSLMPLFSDIGVMTMGIRLMY